MTAQKWPNRQWLPRNYLMINESGLTPAYNVFAAGLSVVGASGENVDDLQFNLEELSEGSAAATNKSEIL